MRLFQSRPGNRPVKNKTVRMLGYRLQLMEKQIADWLNARTKDISERILLAALVMFCSLGTLVCLALIIGKIK